MDPTRDPCTGDVWWSAVTAAQGDSTLAGVLTGLLIAAAAALLVSWYEESDPHTIALFGSGVPALAFSTFLFTVIAGMDFPLQNNPTKDQVAEVCSQVWSQWLLAISLLFIGGAFLICGLGWALVSYADTFAAKMFNSPETPSGNPKRAVKSETITVVKNRRQYFIRLSGWLSLGIITMTVALLTSANVLYVRTTTLRPEHKWYLILWTLTIGMLVAGHSARTAFIRTRSAQRANLNLCVAYSTELSQLAKPGRQVTGSPPDRHPKPPAAPNRPKSPRCRDITTMITTEITFALAVALGAQIAVSTAPTSSGPRSLQCPVPRPDDAPSDAIFVLGIVLTYLTIRATWGALSKRRREATTKSMIQEGAAADTEPLQRPGIRIHYDAGHLSYTTRYVVALAIAAAFFDVALTQHDFGRPQTVVTLLMGGVLPVAVLWALSFSIPAAKQTDSPP